MSTYAAVFLKNPNTGLFSGFDVKYDGYIVGGVGETLFKHYNDINKISELCYDSRSEMRFLEPEVNQCEWFSDEISNRAKSFKNLSFDQMINKGKQYRYCYIFYPYNDEYMWMFLDKNDKYGSQYSFNSLETFINEFLSRENN